MARQSPRKRVDRAKSASYRSVADDFYRAARVAQEHEYWSAAGLLLVHASIALADAVAIHLGGVRSTSDSHMDTVALLGEVAVRTKEREQALQHLRRVIDEKNRVAYTGEPFRPDQVGSLSNHVERFRAWAARILGE